MITPPQPYEAIVDDLLTGLTGGQVREEHRFEPGRLSYPLNRPLDAALTAFTRVAGLKDGQARLFRLGRDFELAGEGAD
ncbi:MAG TPA: hypothetical protein VNK05_06415, partial [Chloroflexota bacterium]|nr:hypothetical protein [Chloroflexota bacterium]